MTEHVLRDPLPAVCSECKGLVWVTLAVHYDGPVGVNRCASLSVKKIQAVVPVQGNVPGTRSHPLPACSCVPKETP